MSLGVLFLRSPLRALLCLKAPEGAKGFFVPPKGRKPKGVSLLCLKALAVSLSRCLAVSLSRCFFLALPFGSPASGPLGIYCRRRKTPLWAYIVPSGRNICPKGPRCLAVSLFFLALPFGSPASGTQSRRRKTPLSITLRADREADDVRVPLRVLPLAGRKADEAAYIEDKQYMPKGLKAQSIAPKGARRAERPMRDACGLKAKGLFIKRRGLQSVPRTKCAPL